MMNVEEVTGCTANELFLGILPVLTGLFTIAIITFSGKIALYTGVLFGVGVVLLAGLLGYRETQ